MPNVTFDSTDVGLKQIGEALISYERTSPGTNVDIVRENDAAILIQIVDPQFAGLSKVERSQKVWPLLRVLPNDVQDDISALLLLAPQERFGLQ